MQKDNRKIKSFEPDDDVERMLAKVRSQGTKMGFVINKALRKFLIREGWAGKMRHRQQVNQAGKSGAIPERFRKLVK